MSNANLFADDGLRVRCIMSIQILAANGSAAFESRASKFLVTNRTLSYCAQVSGTRKSGTRMRGTRAKLLVPVSGTRNLGGELGSCVMGLRSRPTTTTLIRLTTLTLAGHRDSKRIMGRGDGRTTAATAGHRKHTMTIERDVKQ